MKLRRMRVLRQLSLADAARLTRISASRLADLETDEYSNFPNLAYAKSFLRSYARFLEADLQAYLEAFEDTSTFGLDDYQYLSDRPVGVFRIPRRQQRTRKIRRSSVLMTASLVGIFAIVVFGWFFYVTYQRLGDLSKLADRQEARERGDVRPGAGADGKNGRLMQPVSNPPTPESAAPASPAPQASPSPGETRGSELVAVTLAESSLTAAVTQLSVPAASLPVTPTAEVNPVQEALPLRPMLQKTILLSNPMNPVNAIPVVGSAAGFSGGGKNFLVHHLDNNSVDVFRTGVPRPQNPAGNNTLE